ncbi:MAG: small ribosomal subunit Rsm22 family protein [Ktedonobacterales bacterium]
MDLPPDLRAALDETLAPYPPRALADATDDLSRRYRTSAGPRAVAAGASAIQAPAPSFIRSDLSAAAYAAFRLPATYAAITAALTQARNRRPNWRPQTLLDLGAGSGSALWAALTVWPDLTQATLLERDVRMIALGRRLAESASAAVIQRAQWRRGDMTALDELSAGDGYDLVTVGYALGELRAPERAALIERLWECVAPAGALALIEPGTPSGYTHILAARDALIAAGATVLAPCPHHAPCPMAATDDVGGSRDWCHFAQRLPRSRLHRQVKGGALAYEDEKFAYVVAARLPKQAEETPESLIPIGGRVVRHPQIRPGVIGVEVCAPEGMLRHATYSKRDRAAWHMARNVRWGDALPATDAPTPLDDADLPDE